MKGGFMNESAKMIEKSQKFLDNFDYEKVLKKAFLEIERRASVGFFDADIKETIRECKCHNNEFLLKRVCKELEKDGFNCNYEYIEPQLKFQNEYKVLSKFNVSWA